MNPQAPNAAILLTSRAPAAIAVIRIRGPAVRDFLKNFSRPTTPSRAVHGELRDGDRVIDDPVIVVAPDYSWADISVHGGAWVVSSVLELARKIGFTIFDDPTPPSPEIAFDESSAEIEREMLAHLPLAKTTLAIQSLQAQPAAWESVKRAAPNIPAILADRSLWHLLHPPRIAIVGEPNVGKSTLANQLFGQERSITADLPGTTRDWVGEIANIDGLAVTLIDTPGQRQTTDAIEHAAINASHEQIQTSDLVIHVLDATIATMEIGNGDAASIGITSCVPVSVPDAILVVNKIDQPAGLNFQPHNALRISARTGEGLDALRVRILAHFGIDPEKISQPKWWTQRQRSILARAIRDPNAIKEL